VNPDADEESLSLVGIRAPIAGTIESKRFSKAERVVLGDSLFVLANTTRLWVAADIREREWLALSLKNGQSLIVDSPALPDRRLQAQVEYIGREVDPRSNAVPLVALIQNEDGLLRPGQFVWVQLPLGSPHSGLAVPAEAVVEHEGRKFVFAPAGEGSFRRRDVAVGLQQGPWAEIVSGLSDREEIVVKGAFLLKSELLLEREE
jgi:cobalt-zinc-cadmium efflux system membrane fusion protein